MSVSIFLVSLFTVMELNCENMFDCQHDTLKNDYDFLPTAVRMWTPSRYWRKLDNISKEIAACGNNGDERHLPDLIALCEVENDTVMRDLTRRSALRKARYDYVMTDSPDLRGVDVALLYSPLSFRPINTIPFRIPQFKDHSPTRDILYVGGLIATGDTLHIYIVHAPSRVGGEEKSRPFRLYAAHKLRSAIDSLQVVSPRAKIMIMGDFNDYATDSTLCVICGSDLTNISSKAKGCHGALGTYRFQGEWGSLDQFIVSKSLLYTNPTCRIEDDEFLMEDDKTYGGVMPRRNYKGYRYNNGFSDHLPLVSCFVFD